MREILFRGKRVDPIGNRLEWVYGSLIKTGNYCCILPDDDGTDYEYPYLDGDLGTIDGQATPVSSETIGQFTGLIDKNGKKIFEGDIVRYDVWACNPKGTIEVVEWVDCNCGFEPFCDSKNNCGHCGGGAMPEDSEIIGNIHDNPELMNG